MMAVCSFGLRLPLDLSRPFHQVSPASVCVRVEHRTSCRETSVRGPQGLMNGARPWRAATRLAELVLVGYGSEPEPALSILRDCVSLLEKEVAFSAPAFPAVPLLPTMPGVRTSRSSCLNALVVALNETCNGKSWYTSTKELQLASLEFCVACRNYQTLHLKVDAQIPRRLLCKGRCPTSTPAAAMLDARATAKSAPRAVGHAESSGIEHPDNCNNRRGLAEVWRGLRWKR
ncbi:unnamed protein product [Ectocarpus sp. 6 AP-2014]